MKPTLAVHPTPFPEVNALLQELLAGVQIILGQRFIGLYVHGSAASGDFEPRRSDIDFLVVTADDLPEEMLPALQAMHARIRASGMKWATKLEGSYVPQQALLRYDPANAQHPALRVDGSFDVDGHGIDWVIQRHVIRERGIAVVGPDPKVLIDPVTPDDLRRAAWGTLQQWWAPQLQDHSRLCQPEYRAYAVLTMCRVWYTIQLRTVVPKGVAAQWAQQALGEPWAALIKRALAWPADQQADTLSDTLQFLRYTIERSQGVVSVAGN